jgi:hypothetical protein
MRRRQIYQAERTKTLDDAIAPLIAVPTPFADFIRPNEPVMIEVDPPRFPGKGDCPKCGKFFARGLHFHAPACKGAPDGG